MEIQFGVAAWLWTSPFDSTKLDLFPKIKEMGFDAVEIPVEDPADIDVERVRISLDAHGLQPILIGAFGRDRDLSSDDPSVQRNGLDYIRSCLEIGCALGAHIFAGPMYSAVGSARSLPVAARMTEWKRSVAKVREAGMIAGDYGMVLALEPLNRFESDMVNNTDDVLRFIGDVDCPSVGVALDGFHMHIEEDNIERAVRKVSDRLVYVQVSESHRGIPGTGQFDWTGLRCGLEAINYRGTVSIESFAPGCSSLAEAVCIWKPLAPSQDIFAEEGLKFLRQWGKNNNEIFEYKID